MFGVKYLDNPWREKFNFFFLNLQVSCFEVQKNGRHGSYRLGVEKS